MLLSLQHLQGPVTTFLEPFMVGSVDMNFTDVKKKHQKRQNFSGIIALVNNDRHA
jgi:hypothetical protein